MAFNRFAVLHGNTDVYMLTPLVNEVIIRDAPTLKGAISALLRVAPPHTLQGVYITACSGFQSCQRTVEALQKAGYTNIESIDSAALMASSFIYRVPLSQALGEVVFIHLSDNIIVLQRCMSGWKIVAMHEHITEALANYPSVRHVVYDPNLSDNEKAEFRVHFPHQKLHPSFLFHPFFMITFVRNRINKGNLNGYEVLPHCCFDLTVKFGDKCETIPLKYKVPSFTVTKEVDVGFVPFVEIHVDDFNESKKTLIKTLEFIRPASRTVSITVKVNKTFLPKVTLQTVATHVSAVHTKKAGLNAAKIGKLDDPTKLMEAPTNPCCDIKSRFKEMVQSRMETVSIVDKLEAVTAQSVDPPASCQDVSISVEPTTTLLEDISQLYDSPFYDERTQERTLRRTNGKSDELTNPTEVPTSCDDEVDQIGSITTLPNDMSKLKLNSPPKTILTFTSDNRVMIETDESYTGDEELLAYVRLEAGKPPVVGQRAFDALKTHPDSVFYDIARLLAADFDPDHPDPSWGFETTCSADGQVIVHGGNDFITFPSVLFCLVVKNTLLHIRKHTTSEVHSLGIRLPAGSMISDTEVREISQIVGVDVVIF